MKKLFALILFLNFGNAIYSKGHPPYLTASYNQSETINYIPGIGLTYNYGNIPFDSVITLYIFEGDSVRTSAYPGGNDGIELFRLNLGDSLIYEKTNGAMMQTCELFLKDPGTYHIYASNETGGSSLTFKIELLSLNLNKKQTQDKDEYLLVFPNPVTNLLTLHGEETLLSAALSFQIVDLIGKEYYFLQFQQEEFREQIKINVAFIPDGNYLIILRTDGFTYTRKITKSS